MLSEKQKMEYSRKRSRMAEAERWKMDCPVCLQQIEPETEDVEYVKTKRGTEIWIHTACVQKWGRS